MEVTSNLLHWPYGLLAEVNLKVIGIIIIIITDVCGAFPCRCMPKDASHWDKWYKIHNKRSRQKSSNSSDPSRQRRYKVRDLIPREIANISMHHDTRCYFTPACQSYYRHINIIFLLIHYLNYLLCMSKSCEAKTHLISILFN